MGKLSKASPPLPSEKAKGYARSRGEIADAICAELRKGSSLQKACRTIPDAPDAATFLQWVAAIPDIGQQYAESREVGYKLLADELLEISDESDVKTRYEGEEVTLALDATAVARNRLRLDTRKWLLSKMLPKIYGDRLTTELTGANGGAIHMASVNVKNLTDEELAQMEALLRKANQP